MRRYVLLVALTGACSGSSSNDSGGGDAPRPDARPKLECPAGGIGIASSSGKKCDGPFYPNEPDLKDCKHQVEQYMDYSCLEPQACVSTTTLMSLRKPVEPTAPPQPLSFMLTNCSTGDRKLTIQQVEVLGDERCHFQLDPKTIAAMEILPGETRQLSVSYQPLTPGQDHMVLVLHNNSENFPTLTLRVCGLAVIRYVPGLDSGPPPDFGPTITDAGTFILTCQDQSTVASCHKQGG